MSASARVLRLPSPDEVREAARRLEGVARVTPLRRSEGLRAMAGTDVYLKLECEQVTGSFKIRGAYNSMAQLPAESRARGVVASSAGNHGQGVAAAAKAFGLGWVPLEEERYDLVVPDHLLGNRGVIALLELLKSQGLRAQVEALGGYDVEGMGVPA